MSGKIHPQPPQGARSLFRLSECGEERKRVAYKAFIILQREEVCEK